MWSCEGAAYDAFRAGLRDVGWVEGRNLIIEARGAGGQLDRLPELARELVALNPALIVPSSSPQPSRAAKDATSVLRIVFVAVADPIRVGLVQNLPRPGGNVTRVAALVPGGFMAKQLELLKEAVPRAVRVRDPRRNGAAPATGRSSPMDWTTWRSLKTLLDTLTASSKAASLRTSPSSRRRASSSSSISRRPGHSGSRFRSQ